MKRRTGKIIYYSADGTLATNETLSGWIGQFTTQLQESVPIRVDVKQVNEELSSRIGPARSFNVLDKIRADLRNDIDRFPFLVVVLPGSHRIVGEIQQENRGALYGAQRGGVAVVYCPKNLLQHVLWHEMYRLFGAAECYDSSDRGPTCGMSNCIMQHDAPQCDLSQDRIICEANVDRLQALGITRGFLRSGHLPRQRQPRPA